MQANKVTRKTGIYLHIPFCRKACHYCDFHFSTLLKYKKPFLDALHNEIAIKGKQLKPKQIDTIYFGGGTPSVLRIEEINEILISLEDYFPIDQNTEITLELNPEDGTKEYLEGLKKIDVSRLSIGCQSFNNDILKSINRHHSAKDSINVVKMAQSLGFEEISIDLIYGIPNNSLNSFKHDVDTALLLRPEHISAYSMTIEEGTVFGKWKKQNRLHETTEKDYLDQYEYLIARLGEAGYEQYEISNFARDQKYAKHNTAYWFNNDYIGFGPGAHSFFDKRRSHNIANNAKYIQSISKGDLPEEKEELTRDDQINEFILTRLRTMWGLPLDELKSRYQHEIPSTLIKEACKQKLIEVESDYILLSEKGKLLADEVSMKFFV